MFAPEQRKVPEGTTLPNGLVTLELEGSSSYSGDGKPVTVQASKAELCLLSSVLREAFIIEPDCQTLKVEGTLAAWRLAALYLSRTAAERTAAFYPLDDYDRVEAAELLTAVLAIAKQYDMPLLMKECSAVARSWGECGDQQDIVGRLLASPVGLDPKSAVWWIDLAEKYGQLYLAAPALKALISNIREGNHRLCMWREDVLPYVNQRGAVVQLFEAIVDNC